MVFIGVRLICAMKNKIFTAWLFAFVFAFSLPAQSRDIPAIVSTEWLVRQLDNPQLKIIDIRPNLQYAKGHIPSSLNVPMSFWAISKLGLSLELPEDASLRDLIERSGIGSSSWVVIVNNTETSFSRADATRVAWTCMIAGLNNVAVLDGGYTKWVKEDRIVSNLSETPNRTTFSEMISKSTIAAKSYVQSRLGKSRLVDTRIPEDYFGIASKGGHIKGAVNAPTPWMFSKDGTYISEKDLRAMAEGVIGSNKSKEIIVYCGVGGYASTWWFVLTQILGYRNVKLYDGSMEEWLQDSNAPVSKFTWH
jgi:thiosulfate/3-mercaptopyruvate sulfurtransferase